MAVDQTEEGKHEAGGDWNNEVSLSLTAMGGRVFVHGATAESSNRSTLELKCKLRLSWSFDVDVLIGDQRHSKPPVRGRSRTSRQTDEEETGWKLEDCSIMLSIYEVDQKWLDDPAKGADGDSLFGQLRYHDPIKTSDGVVNEVYPRVTAWAGMGTENFRLLRDRLLADDVDNIDLGIRVRFPDNAVDHGWTGIAVKWDGKGGLPIVETVAVVRRQNWSADEDDREARRQARDESATDETRELEAPYQPSREQVELVAAARKIETGIERLALPLWLAVIALVVIAFRLLR
jgi:hypothetical protein